MQLPLNTRTKPGLNCCKIIPKYIYTLPMFPLRFKEDPTTHNILTVTPLKELHYAKGHGITKSDTTPLIFEIAKFSKPKVVVIIGTGDGLIPRVLREAQIAAQVPASKTYLIDLGETMGAMPDKIHNPKSLFRVLYPEIVVFKGRSCPDGLTFLKKHEQRIDILWIDGDHSFEGSLADFKTYKPLMSEDGLIFLHDTAPNGANAQQPEWCGVDKTIKYIKAHCPDIEMLNFTPTPFLELGMGFAILKKNKAYK